MLIVAIALISACKKNKTAPVITVTGDNPVSIVLGSTYTDAGATAVNGDESAAEVTTDASSINTSLLGSYTVTYSSTNEYGTTNATRTVNVVLDQASWIGDYDVVDDCGTAASLQDVQTFAAGATTNDIIISNVVDLVGGDLNATISGTTLTIPQQDIDLSVGTLTISGTGTMNNDGTAITLSYTYDNTTPFIGGQGTCTATYTKQ